MENKNPWLALSTYEEGDQYRFKGREEDTNHVLTMLQQNEYITIYAASGDGKSSLINAGICPPMRKLGYFPIKITLPYNSSAYSDGNGVIDFDKLISEQIGHSLAKSEEYFRKKYKLDNYPIVFEKIDDYKENDVLDKQLWWKLRTEYIQIPFGEFYYTPVLIFDQFEEIFRTQYKYEFFKWLEMLSKDICPDNIRTIANEENIAIPVQKRYKIIFSMRYEYVGELDYHSSQRCYIPQMMRSRYFLKPLNAEQAKSIITEQNEGDAQALDIIKRNAETIIAGLNKQDTANNAEIPAILLSILCYVYYNNIIDNGSIELPDTKNLISKFYTDKLSELNLTDSDIAVIEDGLVTSEGNRKRSVFVGDVPTLKKKIKYRDGSDSTTRTMQLWEVLKNAHLLYVENKDYAQYVEFVHDKLAEAAFENRNLRNRRKKAEWVKWLLGIIGVILFFGVFWHQSDTKVALETPVFANNIDKFAEYQVINTDSTGSLYSESLKKVKLVSNTGRIDFAFANSPYLPNLQEIVLCDTLKNNYRWENGILWSLNQNHLKDGILFAAKDASRSIDGVTWDYQDFRGIIFYNAKYLNDNRDSLARECLEMAGDTLISLREPASLLDTLDLSIRPDISFIGRNAFDGCMFRHIVLPDSLSRISSYAFKNCNRLKTVKFRNTKRLICDPYSFYKCDSIKEIELPDSCILTESTFYDCVSLRKVSSCRSVSLNNFPHCDTVTYLCRRDTNNTIKTDTISEHKTETIVGIRYSVKEADKETIYYGIYVCGVTLGSKEFIRVFLSDSLSKAFDNSLSAAQIRRSPRNLTDIYIINKDIAPRIEGLDSIDCSNITLHVPYNTLAWMKNHYVDNHFKEIIEMSHLENSLYYLIDSITRIRFITGRSLLLIIVLIVVSIPLFVSVSIDKKHKKIAIKRRLRNKIKVRTFALNVLLGFIFGLAAFWYICFEFGINLSYASFCGIVAFLISAAISMKSDWIQDNFVRLFKRVCSAIKAWIKKERKLFTFFIIPLSVILLLALYFDRSYSNYTESIQSRIEELRADGDMKTVAAIMNDGMLSADTSKIDDTFQKQSICAVSYDKPLIINAVLDAEGRYLYTITADSVLSKWDVESNQMIRSEKMSHELNYIKYSYSNNSIIVASYRDSTFTEESTLQNLMHETHMKFIELDTDLKNIAERDITVSGYAFKHWLGKLPDISDDGKKVLSYDGNILNVNIAGSEPIVYTFNQGVNSAEWIDNTRIAIRTDSLHIFDTSSNLCTTFLPVGQLGYPYYVSCGTNNIIFLNNSLYDYTIDGKLRNSMVITRLNVEAVHNLNNSYALSWQDSVFIYNTKNDLISKMKIRGRNFRIMLKSNKKGNRFVLMPNTFLSKSISVYDTDNCYELMHLGTPEIKQIVEAGPNNVQVLSEDRRVYEVDFKKLEIRENKTLSDCYPDYLSTSKEGLLAVCGGKLMLYKNSTLKEYTAQKGAPHISSLNEPQEKTVGDNLVDNDLREVLQLTGNKYCVATNKTLYLYTTDKMEFVKNCHLSKEQVEEFDVPWWIYAFRKVRAYWGNN